MKAKIFWTNNKRYVFMVLTLFWACVIFSFSLQPAEASSQLSSGFGTWLVETFLPFLENTLQTMSEEGLGFLHHLLRKCGHFAEYFILGMLAMQTATYMNWKYKKVPGMVFCVLVASLDETIQLFVDGRSGQVTDVMLDSAGALVGAAVLLLIGKIINSRKAKRSK